jgi:hypothetical protein
MAEHGSREEVTKLAVKVEMRPDQKEIRNKRRKRDF